MNSVTLPTSVYVFSILTSLFCIILLFFVLKTQLQQFKVKSDLQGMKVLLTVMIGSLLLANLITLTISLIYFDKPVPAAVIAVSSSANRSIAILTTISLALVYKFQIKGKQ